MHVQHHAERERLNAYPYRRPSILAGEIARREHLHENEAEQPRRVSAQASRRHHDVAPANSPRKNSVANSGSASNARPRLQERNEEHEAQRPVECRGEPAVAPERDAPTAAARSPSRSRSPKHTERKLDQAIRVVEPRHAPRDEERRNERIEQDTYLRDRRAEHHGSH